MKYKPKIDLLILFIGVVFLFASIYRIFNYNAGVMELNQLNIPVFLLPFIILLEGILGIFFIINKKVVYASLISIVFLITAIIIAFVFNFTSIIKNIPELFVFNSTPTDILLHITYVILLCIIFIRYRKK